MKTRALLALSAVLASGLAAGAADAAVKKPKPKPIPACPSFVDPAKDDMNADAKAGEDPALDIVKTAETFKGGVVTMTITLAKFGDPTYADGAQYVAGFTVGGKLVELFGAHSRSKPVMDQAFALAGIQVDGTYVKGSEAKVTYLEDAATNSVKLSASLADISAAVGSKVDGAQAGGFESNVEGSYGALIEPYDTSAPATSIKLPIADCKI